MEIGGGRPDADQPDLGQDADHEGNDECRRHREAEEQREPALSHQTATAQRWRRSRTMAPGSGAPKTAFPATKVSAPAA